MIRTLALALLVSAPALAAPTASDAWIRANAVPGRPAAGYLVLNGGAKADTLVGVTSPGLRIELHSMSMDGGIMKMAKLESVPVPAGAKVALATGGNHLMIFGMTGAQKTVPLSLAFSSGAKVTTSAEVRAPGAMAPMADPHAGHEKH